MPLIGIVSDTHGRISQAALEALAGADYIIHAGDIGARGILWDLEALTTTIAVLGNNDYYADYAPDIHESARQLIGDVNAFVTHYPQDAEAAARTGNYGLVIHGHTHIPRDEVLGDCRIINPGSATRPRGGSMASIALVRIEDGKIGPVRTIQV